MSKDKDYTVKGSRIRELAGECPEYAKAMRILFPEALEEGLHYITDEVAVHLCHGQGENGKPDMFIELYHNGETIGAVNNRGIEITAVGYKKHVDAFIVRHFQVTKE